MPSTFVTPLKFEPAYEIQGTALLRKMRNGRPLFRVLEPFVYDIGFLGSGVTIEVELGFETDFASIPRVVDRLFGLNPTGRHNKASVIHDKLYKDPELAAIIAERIFIEERAPLNVCGLNVGKYYDKAKPRFSADLIMLEASGVLGVDLFTRHLHFLGVRFGGFEAFQRAIAQNPQTTLKGDNYV